MRQEIIKGSVPQQIVPARDLPAHDEKGTYVAVTESGGKTTVAVMRHDFGGRGYIFRHISSNERGHSGYHDTVRQACESALNCDNTRVYRFDSLDGVVSSEFWVRASRD